jgi:hypothetical protein
MPSLPSCRVRSRRKLRGSRSWQRRSRNVCSSGTARSSWMNYSVKKEIRFMCSGSPSRVVPVKDRLSSSSARCFQSHVSLWTKRDWLHSQQAINFTVTSMLRLIDKGLQGCFQGDLNGARRCMWSVLSRKSSAGIRKILLVGEVLSRKWSRIQSMWWRSWSNEFTKSWHKTLKGFRRSGICSYQCCRCQLEAWLQSGAWMILCSRQRLSRVCVPAHRLRQSVSE